MYHNSIDQKKLVWREF